MKMVTKDQFFKKLMSEKRDVHLKTATQSPGDLRPCETAYTYAATRAPFGKAIRHKGGYPEKTEWFLAE